MKRKKYLKKYRNVELSRTQKKLENVRNKKGENSRCVTLQSIPLRGKGFKETKEN
jgi:hypothetical protein